MIKRILLTVFLVFGLMGLGRTEGWAAYSWSPGGGAVTWGANTYTMTFSLQGAGSSSYMAGTFIGADIEVLEACLVCTNPGTNKKDVRFGFGGTILFITTEVTPGAATSVDERGRFSIESDEIYSERDEVVLPSPLCPAATNQQECFNYIWDVSSADCKNSSTWDPFAFLVKSVNITGTLWVNCPEGWLGPYDEVNCDNGGTVSVFCETQEDCRDWPGSDNTVLYTCVDLGNPIAWDDYFSTRAGRTLNVSDPGVLENDHDTGTTPSLTLTVFHAAATGTTFSSLEGGTVTIYSNGSFRYVPPGGFTGDDSFTYQATDGTNRSNEAMVHINVR